MATQKPKRQTKQPTDKSPPRVQFETVNIEYLTAVIFFGIALVSSVFCSFETTAGNIAAGLIGYIGGRVHAAAKESFSNNEGSKTK